MFRSITTALVLGIAPLLLSNEANSAIIPISSNRTVQVDGIVDADPSLAGVSSFSETASETDPSLGFFATVRNPGHPSWFEDSGNPNSQLRSLANIDSSPINSGVSSVILATGNIDVEVAEYGFGGVIDVPVSRSIWSTTFDLTEPTQYSISGTVGANVESGSLTASAPATARIALSTLAGPIFTIQDDALSIWNAIIDTQAGVLPPGQYTLEAEAHFAQGGIRNELFQQTAFWNLDASFITVPEPGTFALTSLGGLFGLAVTLRRRWG